MTPVEPHHIDEVLADGLRAQDVDEVLAAGMEPNDALRHSAAMSGPHTFALLADGVAAAIFGVVDTDKPGVGQIWMLGSDRCHTIRRGIMEEGFAWHKYFFKIYHTLTNHVDSRNTVSIDWLERMGYNFPGDEVTLASGVTFRRFVQCVSEEL